MWNNSKSVVLSSVLVKVCLVLSVVAAFFFPTIVRLYVANLEHATVFVPLLIMLYLLLLPAWFALFKLNKLLTNISKGKVFVNENTANLRALSYCCFAAAFIFALSIVFWPFYGSVAFFVTAFIGLILRVVKNVFAIAVELREENDAVI